MDTYFEQLVPIKSTGKTKALFFGIWIAAILLVAACMLFLWFYIPSIALLLVFALLYGAYKLSLMLFVEYEYIITNGSVDIDKITAKSSRKRIACFELSEVQSLERYNPAKKPTGEFKKSVVACNPNDEAYSMIITKSNGDRLFVVYAPNERMKEASCKFLPKHIANSAFKD